ncbi:Peptidoglycan/LPS O-acetylase OafA/YrhL, contains acyltransferase and SGNH-hydrolase domains [Chryseolinea serpens]|uniref:Peptidoglycan/LPS O-acetylase OafA/YrhL, contains acyltransferase and SGNH-hydrolase domains n=1 Tax=Chryseolinea serpens TaxID=947013 RepID=A0A1M5KY22_9BACT|nr:acyltransferase [Chryseolinea serpens]SHG57605.1 Peptidoglycan/LPS O-acetylase OafA/YrhL, contains acyltransferase and SGNH-hydrolase domains [Chryseolinea serpens]
MSVAIPGAQLSTQGKRIEQLTFTRFVAAVAIVIFHDGLEVFPFYLPGIHTVFSNAFTGVSYFFLLSGFVMVIAYTQVPPKPVSFAGYYVNRFARIYPAYFLALAGVTLIFIFSNTPVGGLSVVFGFLLLQAWVPGYAVTLNVPGWSLSVEFFFYLVFPFLFNAFYRKKENYKIILWVVMAMWLVTQIISNVGPAIFSSSPIVKDIFYYHPLMHINEFVIGNFFALFFLRHTEARYFGNHAIKIFLLLIVIVAFMLMSIPLNVHNGLLALYFVPLILLLAYDKGPLSDFFSKPVAVLLGEISYGIYIYQKPVRYVVFKLYSVLGIHQKELCFYGFLLALIVWSYLSYRFFEQPVRKAIQSRFKSRSVPSVAPVN